MSYVPDLNAYGMLSDLGKNIAAGFQQYQQKQLLSELGKDLMGGDYNSAAQKALAAGDMGTGLKLLELGRQRQVDAQLPGLLAGTGGGASPAQPAAPATQTPSTAQMPQSEDGYNYSGMSPDFAARLNKFIDDNPHEVSLNSGYRSPERQAKLFADAVQKYGSVEAARKWVAPPGHSQHNKGFAADLGLSSPEAAQWAHDNAAKYGLNFPMSHEKWHVELAGVRGGQPPAPLAAPQDIGARTLGGYVKQKQAAEEGDTEDAAPAKAGAAKVSGDGENAAKIAALRDQQTRLTVALATVSGDGPKAAINARLQQIKDQITELKPDKEKYHIVQTEDGYRWINKSDPSQFQDVKTGTRPKTAIEYESRKAIAADLGLTGAERKLFLANGSLPDKANKDIADANRQREAEADRLGLQGEDRQQYVLNGKVPTAGEKQTGDQANAAIYARRMAESERVLNRPEIQKALMSRTEIAKGMVPGVGNSMVSKEYQMADQAKRDFINAVLRRESGAAIAQSEFENANKQYFPQPGDAPEVLAQKARNRQVAIEGIANAATPQFREEFFGTKKPGLGVGLRDNAQPAKQPASGLPDGWSVQVR